MVFLHGLASSGAIWQKTITNLEAAKNQKIAYDLLGFGLSPKPDWLKYTLDDHARAVIASLMHVRGPVVLTGHSMGALIAVRVAWLRPDLVKHLVLYQMPVYSLGASESKSFKWRRDIQFLLYNQALKNPARSLRFSSIIGSLAANKAGFWLDGLTWHSFANSLTNAIMQQETVYELTTLTMPIDIITGQRDVFVMSSQFKAQFKNSDNITFYSLNVPHGIPLKASRYLAQHLEKIAT